MFRVVLDEMTRLCQLRQQPEQRAEAHLSDNADFQRQDEADTGDLLEAAATIVIHQKENSFRYKFERYLRKDPTSTARKRMAYVAVPPKWLVSPMGSSSPEPTTAASMKWRRQVEEPLL